MTTRNLILATDSYKYSHYIQLPPGTTEMSAYIEARAGGRFDEVTFFGLQILLQNLKPIHQSDVYEAENVVTAHIPGLKFNRDGWDTIVKEFDGNLPVEIQAIPEGMTVPVGTPLVQVRNTDPRFSWLTTFIETVLLRAVWYPSTVATQSREAKKIIYAGLLKSSEDPDGQIPFKLHDFGARGCTSAEQAAIGGAAHLVNFMGTDTVEGLMCAKAAYGAGMPGYSIPAAEHSTITSWGRGGEVDAYRNMLKQFGGEGKLVAVVSDSYDIKTAVREIWGTKLHAAVEDMGGTLVVRPDSGDPVQTPIWVLKELANKFGTVRNAKGYHVLNKAVRVIQGDGMNLDTIDSLVRGVLDAGFSMDNIAMGMGGGLLQQLDRDTLRFAMKANEAVVKGAKRDVSKAPASDPTKNSKAGRQKALLMPDGRVTAVREDVVGGPAGAVNLLQPVWRDGKLLRKWTFDEVRQNAKLTPAALKAAA